MNTRKEAMAAGVGTYLTGKPCKYGHLSYRYTQSGACAECVAQSAATGRELLGKARREFREATVAKKTEALQPILAARRAREEALKGLNTIKVAIHAQDVDTVFNTAIELCLSAYPCLDRSDVTPSRTPIKGDPLYKVLVPHEQEQLLRDVANTLYNLHGVDVSRFADKVAAQVERMAEDESSSPPEGWK